VFVTGGTYNDITGDATFTNNTGGTFTVTGFTSGISSGGYVNNIIPSGTTITVPQNQQYIVYGNLDLYGQLDNLGNVVIINGTLNNSGGTFNNSGTTTFVSFPTGDTYTIGASLNGNIIEFDRTDLNNAYSVDLSPILTGATGGSGVTVTGGTYIASASTLTFTNTTGGTFSVTGVTDPVVVEGSGSQDTVRKNLSNTASGNFATVSGGGGNIASGFTATVGGGQSNTALGFSSTIAGGYFNQTRGFSTSTVLEPNFSSIGGGVNNGSTGCTNTIAGGNLNKVIGGLNTISGGFCNNINATGSTIGGGLCNVVNAELSGILGGDQNILSQFSGYVTIISETSNTLSGVPNSQANFISNTTTSGSGSGISFFIFFYPNLNLFNP
jgi:hypothetical protein